MLWGGRFEGETDAQVWEFNQSLRFDQRLWREDIAGSIAHARMLSWVGIIESGESEQLVAGLKAIEAGLQDGTLVLPERAEDIHSAIEQLLTEKIGPLAGKLRTARSRNDQVATDTRLYLRGALDALRDALFELRLQLLELAEGHLEVVLPGRTHHQHAQPVLLAHHLMAYFWMLTRDDERLADCRKRVNLLPLGAGALAGTPFPLDREYVRRELRFEGILENSMDAVASRDFAVEFCACASMVMQHLSRLAEELILWNAPEFGFVEFSDAVATGSSIMPQKKNPDVAELIRGKTGRVFGDLTTLLTLMKGLALAYNKDMQEDKEPLFDAADTTIACAALMKRLLQDATFKPERMRAAMHGDFSTATDLADALAADGVPFREAHEIVGKVVRACLEKGVGLEELTLFELQVHDARFTEKALEAITPLASANARTSRGGTARRAVEEQLSLARAALGITG